MIQVNTHQAKSNLSALLAAVEERDETVVICRNQKPIAELRKLRASANLLAPPHPDLQPSRIDPTFDPVQGIGTEDWPETLR